MNEETCETALELPLLTGLPPCLVFFPLAGPHEEYYGCQG
jgi:hypothetical protein